MKKRMQNTAMDSSSPIVYVVDDDENMREAISAIVESAGYSVAPFSRPEEFLQKHSLNQHGCVLLDIRMPTMSGLEVQQRLNAAGSMLPVIFMSGCGDIPIAVQVMKEGAFDFVQKPFREDEIMDRIGRALRLDAENRKATLQHAELKRRFDTLSQREAQVFKLVTNGHANKAVATELGLSERTVEIHRANVMEKFGARSIAHLVKMSIVLGGDQSDLL